METTQNIYFPHILSEQNSKKELSMLLRTDDEISQQIEQGNAFDRIEKLPRLYPYHTLKRSTRETHVIDIVLLLDDGKPPDGRA